MSSWAVVLSHLHIVTCNHPWTLKQSLFRGLKHWLVCFFLFPRLPILSLLTSIFQGVPLHLLVADPQRLRSALVNICKRRFQSYTLWLLGEFRQIVSVVSFVVSIFTTGQPRPILFLLSNEFSFFLSKCCIWICVLSKVSVGSFCGLLLFVRNTSIFHALLVRGFRGLLLLVDFEVY